MLDCVLFLNLLLVINILVSGVAVFLSVLIFLSIPKDKSVGFDLINNFFANSKAIFTGTVTNDGGLTGTFLYSLFSSVLGYMGIYIVETALIILSVVIHFDFADKDFDQIKDDVATYKKQRREEKAKRKEELLKEKEKKKQLEKEKKLFIDNDSKNKEPDRQQIVSVAKEIVSKPDTLDGKGRQMKFYHWIYQVQLKRLSIMRKIINFLELIN